MAFVPYHNVTYDGGVYHNGVIAGKHIELIAPGENVGTIKAIMITNTDATVDANISLSIENDPTAAVTSTFKILSTIAIPSDTSLLLDNSDIISFDNSANGYGLYLTIGSTDGTTLLDIMIHI